MPVTSRRGAFGETVAVAGVAEVVETGVTVEVTLGTEGTGGLTEVTGETVPVTTVAA